MNKKNVGYFVCVASGSESIVPDVEHIERDDEMMLFDNDYDAAKQAEKDGIKIIHDMEGVEDWTYVDTPENRERLTAWIAEYPEYDCRNW